MLTSKDRTELVNKAQSLLNTKPFSLQVEAQFHSIMKLLEVVDDEARYNYASKTVTELRTDVAQTRELREVEELRHFIHGGTTRTYQALSEGSVPGSVVVPTGQWRREYTSRLVSASGWLQSGLTVKSVMTGRPYISFFDNDSSNAGIWETSPSPTDSRL